MKKKKKNRKVEKKFEKKIILKKKKGKVKKKKEESIVDYCCNPQCFVCGGTVIPPHHLEYVVIKVQFERNMNEEF
jgi:hypothetical protein